MVLLNINKENIIILRLSRLECTFCFISFFTYILFVLQTNLSNKSFVNIDLKVSVFKKIKENVTETTNRRHILVCTMKPGRDKRDIE